MAKSLIIVMYHYIRDLAQSRYPALKGLEAALFHQQLDYLSRHHCFVRPEEFLAALDGQDDALPDNGVLLTFDDGYKDHYRPALDVMGKFGATGIFFVPSRCIDRRQVLDVNKIHFLLASVPQPEIIATAIDEAVETARREGVVGLRPVAAYREIAVPNRFDTGTVIYIKRMLQHVLPLPLRQTLVDKLFAQWVSADEVAFADELYLSRDDLAEMQSAGMLIGSHGSQHLWMNTCERATQAAEIDESLAFLDAIGVRRDQRTFCYPYGGYNDDTLTLLAERGFSAAVTTQVDIADLDRDARLLLPRLDTNDLPKQSDAAINEWSARQKAGTAA